MNKQLDAVLWVMGGLMLAVGLVRTYRVGAAVVASTPPSDVTIGHRSDPSTDSISALADLVIDNDPFRLSNSAPSEQISAPVVRAGLTVANRPRPTLTLKGIAGGPPWLAIIDGLPGSPPATVVKVGDKIDSLVVREIHANKVIIGDRDTTWTLTWGKT